MRLRRWRSLKTRVTLSVLLIFMISTWSLTFYIGQRIKSDLQQLLGTQQFAIASYVASHLDDELRNRITAIEIVAAEIDQGLMRDPGALQSHLEQRSLLEVLFNGGVFITDADGTAIADLPRSAGRTGTNYLDRETVSTPLREGRSLIGRPAMGKKLSAPIFSIAAPVRDPDGAPIGVLVATVNLGKPNFLDKITQGHIGETGGYLLVAPQHNLVVTATDKTRVMQPLPAAGTDAMHDRYMQGFEGFGVGPNSRGILELSAAKKVAVADWFVVVTSPVEDAWAPTDSMLSQIWLGALLVTVLTGALTWWLIARILRQQLNPMLIASQTLASQAISNLPVRVLPVDSQDEIGELVGGFNNLLEILGKRESLLRESEARYRAVFESSNDAININRLSDGLYIEANQAFLDIQGYERHEIVGRTSPELNIWAVPAERQRFVELLRRESRCSNIEARFRRKNGELIWGLVSASVMVFDGVPCIISIRRDITDRKKSELAARRFEAIVQSSEDAIVSETLEGIITTWNPGAEVVFGYRSEEIVGQSVMILVPEECRAEEANNLALIARGESVNHVETRRVRKDGNVIDVSLTTSPIFDIDGQPIGASTIARDISIRKQADEKLARYREDLELLVQERTRELLQAKEQAESASIAKSAFLANMSHELRTPMSAIMGLTQIARKNAGDTKLKDSLDKIELASQHLLAVINDILDISKIEADRLTLEQDDFALGEVLENLCSLVGYKAAEKKLKLRLELPSELGQLELRGDPLRLGQILLNLTTNAVKFTEVGEIRLRARVLEDLESAVLLRFEIQDTGIGIRPADRERLFAAFEQADSSMTRKYGGTGLGLAICKRLVGLMGGEIGVESEPGVGSTFWFTARFEKSTAERRQTKPRMIAAESVETSFRAAYSGTRILLAEDEPINREVSRSLLEDLSLAVDAAEDGVEAVAMAGRTRYALILMDMQMPNLSGMDATRAIRAIPGYENVPILAMTANAFEEDRRACLEAGMDDHIGKPVDPGVLVVRLLHWLSASTR